MTLLRVASAGLLFVGVFLGTLQFKPATVLGVALIVLGIGAMLAIRFATPPSAPHR